MSKLMMAKGILKTLWWMTKEDWRELDHKLYRIAFGVVSFVAVAFFWLFFLRSIIPF